MGTGYLVAGAHVSRCGRLAQQPLAMSFAGASAVIRASPAEDQPSVTLGAGFGYLACSSRNRNKACAKC